MTSARIKTTVVGSYPFPDWLGALPSEQAVIEGLDHLMKGRTTVVIAHHLGTIRHADVIFVVKDAEVVEQGTHEVLLAKGGLYAELYRIQTADGPATT